MVKSIVSSKITFLCSWFQYHKNKYYVDIKRYIYAAKLMTSTGMHNDHKYGKSMMTSHKISDRDNGAKMLIIKFICKINFVLVFKYCILLILR